MTTVTIDLTRQEVSISGRVEIVGVNNSLDTNSTWYYIAIITNFWIWDCKGARTKLKSPH